MLHIDFDKLLEAYAFQANLDTYSRLKHQNLRGLEALHRTIIRSYMNDRNINNDQDKNDLIALHTASLNKTIESHPDLINKNGLSDADINRFKKTYFESFKHSYEEKTIADQSGPKRKIL